jgi:hypothetical protein
MRPSSMPLAGSVPRQCNACMSALHTACNRKISGSFANHRGQRLGCQLPLRQPGSLKMGSSKLESILVILGKAAARPTTQENQEVMRPTVIGVRIELSHYPSSSHRGCLQQQRQLSRSDTARRRTSLRESRAYATSKVQKFTMFLRVY